MLSSVARLVPCLPSCLSPGDIRNHNRMVREVDDDLAQWVSDDCVVLERELRGRMNTAGHQLIAARTGRELPTARRKRYTAIETRSGKRSQRWANGATLRDSCTAVYDASPAADAFPTLSTPRRQSRSLQAGGKAFRGTARRRQSAIRPSAHLSGRSRRPARREALGSICPELTLEVRYPKLPPRTANRPR